MATTTSSTQAQQTIKAYFAAIRSMDRDAWVATFATDGATHDPADAPPARGHEALGKFFDGIVGLTHTVALWEDDVFVCGNQAAVKWTGTGVGKNERAFRFEGIDVFEIDERGKIKTLRGYWNPETLMAQLK